MLPEPPAELCGLPATARDRANVGETPGCAWAGVCDQMDVCPGRRYDSPKPILASAALMLSTEGLWPIAPALIDVKLLWVGLVDP